MKITPSSFGLAALLLVVALPLRAQAPDPLTREREEQTGTAITILFDNSGSMNQDDKIGQAKSAFATWLQSVPATYKFSLITFEGTGQLVVPLGENTRDLVGQRVARLVANTSTPICGSLEIARAQIEKRRREVTPYERQVVLIFTDGGETVDHRGAEGVQAEIMALRQLSVEVVGIGFHGEGDYMNGVATRFALAGDAQELRRGLAQVDAEIGAADNLVVSPADLAALRTFQPPPPPSVFAASGESAAPAQSAPGQQTANPAQTFHFSRWALIFFGLWMVRRLFAKRKA